MSLLVRATLALVLVGTLTAHGQQQAAPRLIVGVVTDTSDDVFVDSVQVYIERLRKRALSKADGTFRLEDIPPGTYQVGVRRFGYAPQVRTVVVGPNGGTVRFRMVPYAQALPTVVTATAATGLSGVVADTAYDTIEGAEAAIVASDRRVRTDSMGRFYLDVRAGKHMVQISRPGYATKLLAVTIPRDSGKRILTTLYPASPAANREAMNLQALSMRLSRAVAARSKLYTREDLMELQKDYDPAQVATRGAGQPVSDLCVAYIDGGPRTMALWLLETADLEMVEVYVGKPARATVTSMSSGATLPMQRTTGGACPTVYAWLRK